VAQREHDRGQTLVGPQRDELIFRLNDFEVRRYGSQGQHRTFGMALKLAQYFYLRDHLDEYPILLLDDAFGKLDPERSAVFLELLQSDAVQQTIITGTRRAPFEETVPFEAPLHQATEIKREEQAATVAAS
jgi:DNA replication and repair protein RecF